MDGWLGGDRQRLPGRPPRAVAVSCGALHTAVLTRQRTLFTFGAGHFGQLGHGVLSNAEQPTLVTSHGEQRLAQALGSVEAVACGSYHTMAVAAGSTVLGCEPAHLL